MPRLALSLAAMLCCTALFAQRWQQKHPEIATREVAWDSAAKRLRAIGISGSAAKAFAAEWEPNHWWSRQQPVGISDPDPDLVFDARRGRLLLFPSNATLHARAWNSQGWQLLSLANPPVADELHFVVADEARREVLAELTVNNERQTWILGARWTKRIARKAPRLVLEDAAWSARTKRVVAVVHDVFSGAHRTSTWDGQRWTTLSVTTPPVLAVAPDPQSGDVLALVRGAASGHGYSALLHRFDGKQWSVHRNLPLLLRRYPVGPDRWNSMAAWTTSTGIGMASSTEATAVSRPGCTTRWATARRALQRRAAPAGASSST